MAGTANTSQFWRLKVKDQVPANPVSGENLRPGLQVTCLLAVVPSYGGEERKQALMSHLNKVTNEGRLGGSVG